jgi:KEOPS complex subunit Pcc1
MKATATVRLKISSEKKLEAILRSLQPEVKSPTGTRSRASLAKEGDLLLLKVQAKDTVALRAGLNAYLRWIKSILNVLQVLEKEQEGGSSSSNQQF